MFIFLRDLIKTLWSMLRINCVYLLNIANELEEAAYIDEFFIFQFFNDIRAKLGNRF